MDTPGGVQNITVINESGLYSLIGVSQIVTPKVMIYNGGIYESNNNRRNERYIRRKKEI